MLRELTIILVILAVLLAPQTCDRIFIGGAFAVGDRCR